MVRPPNAPAAGTVLLACIMTGRSAAESGLDTAALVTADLAPSRLRPGSGSDSGLADWRRRAAVGEDADRREDQISRRPADAAQNAGELTSP